MAYSKSHHLYSIWFFFMISFYRTTCLTIASRLIKNDQSTGFIYTLDLSVGTPPIPISLEVTDRIENIHLFKDISYMSTSYLNILDEKSDIFFFSTQRYRMKFTYSQKDDYTMQFHPNCSYCNGLISIEGVSVMNRISPFIMYSPSSIRINEPYNEIPDVIDSCKKVKTDCLWTNRKRLCTFEGEIFDTIYNISISVEEQYLIVPWQLYDNITRTLNIYQDLDHLSNINIRITQQTWKTRESLFINNNDNTLSIKLRDLIVIDVNDVRILLIKPHLHESQNTVIIGRVLLRSYMVERNFLRNTLTFYNHPILDNISYLNGICFMILLISLVWWKLSNTTLLVTSNESSRSVDHKRFKISKRDAIVNLILQTTSLVISYYTFSFQFTNQILREYESIKNFFVLACVICGIVEGISSFIFIPSLLFIREGSGTYVIRKRNFLTMNTIARNVSHETTISIAMCLCLIERRTEGINNIALTIVSFYFLYNVAFHLSILLVFFIIQLPKIRRFNMILWIYLFILYPLIGLKFSYIMLWDFIYPVFTRAFGIYTESIPTIMMLLIIGILVLTNVTIIRYLKKGNDRINDRYQAMKKNA